MRAEIPRRSKKEKDTLKEKRKKKTNRITTANKVRGEIIDLLFEKNK